MQHPRYWIWSGNLWKVLRQLKGSSELKSDALPYLIQPNGRTDLFCAANALRFAWLWLLLCVLAMRVVIFIRAHTPLMLRGYFCDNWKSLPDKHAMLHFAAFVQVMRQCAGLSGVTTHEETESETRINPFAVVPLYRLSLLQTTMTQQQENCSGVFVLCRVVSYPEPSPESFQLRGFEFLRGGLTL